MQKTKNTDDAKKGGMPRQIDKSARGLNEALSFRLVLASRRNINAWKAYLVILFFGGFCTALILGAYNSWFVGSLASGQVSMFTQTPFPTHKQNDQFQVKILLDTGSQNIVSAQTIATYNTSTVQVLSVDTSSSSSDFTYEIYNNVDSPNGKVSIVVGKPTPGVNSAQAKVAAVTLKALQNFSGAGLSLKFDTDQAIDDCAAILDDGQGTNVLENVSATYVTNDSTAPVRSSGSPSGSLSPGTTQTTISLATNESATCKYSTASGTSYDSMANTFSTTGSTTHSATVSGLTAGNTYHYYVRCQDNYNNANTDDFTITFSVGAYSRADLNLDSSVNITDFNILKSDFLKSAGSLSNARSDINGDGIVTVKDVGIMMSSW